MKIEDLAGFLRSYILGGIALGAVSTTAAAGDDLQHEALAHKWLSEHGVEAPSPARVDLHELVREHFAHLRFGAYELYFPDSAVRENAGAEDLRDVLEALLAAQSRWIEWLPAERGTAADHKAFAKSDKALGTWLKRLKPRTLSGLDPLAGRDLVEVLDPKDGVKNALASIAELMGPGGAFGSQLDGAEPARLVLLPTRGEFVEFACGVGCVKTGARSAYWTADLFNWTSIDFGGTRALPLEFAAPDAANDYTRGITMNSRNPEGLAQHVTQLAIRSLLETTFGERIEPMVAGGLANSLIVEEFGEIDTRTDGDLRSSSVNGRSMFIPASMGGQSQGGVLPPGNADSRWRKERGKGHFIAQLRAAQDAGAGQAKRNEKTLHFQLQSDTGAFGHAVRAPFLGSEGNGAAPPAAYRGDYIEFLRAYRCGFFYWLRTEAGGRGKASKERFGRLLEVLGDPTSGGGDFVDALSRVYDVPLSSAQPGKDDLEGRFLRWLTKQ